MSISRSPEYACWANLIQRCTNPANPGWSNYGGRGIAVCGRWRKFALFLHDVGYRPSEKHSLDRFPDNNGNYEPGNVRWATSKQQAENRRTAVVVTLPDGQEVGAEAAAAFAGVTRQAIYGRRKKWSNIWIPLGQPIKPARADVLACSEAISRDLSRRDVVGLLRNKGYSFSAIAAAMGVSRQRVHQIHATSGPHEAAF